MLLVNKVIKRIFDFFVSFVFLLILIPLFLLIAILIKIDSKGPVFFVQNRRTKNGRIFKMIKFRSMVVNAENCGTGLFNYKNDSRVTKIGKLLRKASLDELPQLINVLCGSLSLVGPRPCVEYELGDFDTLNSKYKKRFSVVAGITGLAQVKGRNENSWEEKVYFDNLYIDKFKKYGVLIDIKILFETVFRVLKKDNIYEEQVENATDEIESAKLAEQEIIRVAHLPINEEEIKNEEGCCE